MNEIIEKIYQDRKNRVSHPEGKFDNAGRWYPSESERCSCCAVIRGPSRAHPYSYMVHCRTKRHITELVKKQSEKENS